MSFVILTLQIYIREYLIHKISISGTKLRLVCLCNISHAEYKHRFIFNTWLH